jgi:hypothetical protein
MRKITFLDDVELVLEQKTDSSETKIRLFKKGEMVDVEEIVFTNDNSKNWFDIVFPRETGWIATGVHKSVFQA